MKSGSERPQENDLEILRFLAKFPEENPNPVFRLSINGHIEYCNKAGERLLGKIGCQTDGDAPDEWLMAIKEAHKSHKSQNIEIKVDEVFYSVTLSPTEGAEYVYGFASDITEKKKIEDELENNREMLSRAQQIAKLGSWDWDIKTGDLKWSDEIYRIFRTHPSQFQVSYEAFLGFVHPEDRDKVKSAIENALNGDGLYGVVHRIISADGHVRFVKEIGIVYFDTDGTPYRMIGTVQDVTEKKLSEDTLKITSKILENILEGVMISDANGNILSINSAFTSITGFHDYEVIGKNPRILKSDRHPKKFYEAMWRSLAESGSWQGEIWNRKKNGEAYPERLDITAIKDEFGKTFRYIAVFYDLTNTKRSEEEIRYKTNYDALTDLPNRTLFQDRLSQAIIEADNKKSKMALMLIGIDGFKRINESLGHSAGDELLQQVAKRFKECSAKDCTVARFGGDEFAILMKSIEDEGIPIMAAEKILQGFYVPFEILDETVFVSASIGVVLYPDDGDDTETIIRNCDTAMHSAKDAGRNTFQIFNPAMNEKAIFRLQIEREMRGGIERDEFIPFFQPKVNLQTGKIEGMEALVRWSHPEKGLISPGLFIPVAEETGLIIGLGENILKESCKIAKNWVDKGYKDILLAVNLSARQFRETDIINTVKSVLNETGLPVQNLELEITESMIMGDVEHAIFILKKLKDMGVQLSIDDFGTGYSSFGYLKRFPINTLKIDIIFIRDMTKSEEDANMVEAIISMARNLKLKVVAEGVETEEQADLLRKFGCDQMQGYYFSKPLNSSQFELLLKNNRLPDAR